VKRGSHFQDYLNEEVKTVGGAYLVYNLPCVLIL
jgi:hypothetical protein